MARLDTHFYVKTAIQVSINRRNMRASYFLLPKIVDDHLLSTASIRIFCESNNISKKEKLSSVVIDNHPNFHNFHHGLSRFPSLGFFEHYPC